MSPALLAALAVLLLALVLRASGVEYGLPFIYDPDEPDFVNRAFRMLESGDLNPHWFGHPGTTTMYSFLAVFAGYAALVGGSLADIAAAFHAEPSLFFRLARWVMLAFGVATVVLTWALARRIAGAWPAVLAAALLAVAPQHVGLSRIARPDAQMTFLALASLWCAVAIVEEGRWRDYLGAGFLLGLAVVTKYPAMLFAVGMVVAHLLGRYDRGTTLAQDVARLGGAALAGVAGIVAGSPYLIFSLPTVLGDVSREARSYHLSATSEGFWSSLGWYFSGPLLVEVGLVGAALALLGAWSVVRERQRPGLVVLVTTLCFLAGMATLTLRWDRWILPVVPLVCVLVALGAREWSRLLTRRVAHPAAMVALGLVGVAAVGISAANSVPWIIAVARGETRDQAQRWIMEHVAPGSRILAESYTPQLDTGRFALYTVSGGQIWPLDATRRKFAVPQGVIGDLADSSAVTRLGMDYVVLANHYDRRQAEPARYGRALRTYEEIIRRSELVFEAYPARNVAVGLPVRVYRVRE